MKPSKMKFSTGKLKHRYINFTFNEAGGGCQNTGTLAKFGQKTGTFSYFQYILTYF